VQVVRASRLLRSKVVGKIPHYIELSHWDKPFSQKRLLHSMNFVAFVKRLLRSIALKPVAVIHSSLQTVENIHQTQPYFEITSGAWIRGKMPHVPKILLNHVKAIFTLKK
jgi:hypothetical protein